MQPTKILYFLNTLLLACSSTPSPPPTPTPPSEASALAVPEIASITPPEISSNDAPSPPLTTPLDPPAPSASPCAEGMVFVEGDYCTKVERTCLKKELNKPNHLEICHEFSPKTRCTGKIEKRAFCIDRYEYPNRPGAHPPWMVSWWDAEATCRSEGKRLCYESEWTTACEGPNLTPFPYGWKRDQTACNIDNIYIHPRLSQMYSTKEDIAFNELERLDQSIPSGSMDRCKSEYGVYDMTGNFDEWVTREDLPQAKDKGKWAALKGGAWGHVRNACRPRTVSHAPEFTYYFISFRCCSDATGSPVYRPAHGPSIPEVPAANRAPLPKVQNAPGPSKQKVKQERQR